MMFGNASDPQLFLRVQQTGDTIDADYTIDGDTIDDGEKVT